MKKTLLATGALALFAGPLIAQEMQDHKGHEGHGAMMAREPMKRTDVEGQVKTHFAQMDTNKDGAVTQAEIDAARTARMSAMHDSMFTKMDTDKNGSISRAEFDAHHAGMMAGGPGGKGGHDGMKMKGAGHGGMARLNGRMFTLADANSDGKVTEAEAAKAALDHFDKVDANRDGSVSDEERKDARMKMRAERKSATDR